MINALIASTSTLHNGSFLEYLLPELTQLYKEVDQITFIPYARPGGISHADYTAKAATALAQIGKKVVGLESYENPLEGVRQAQAFFTGGGNTFVLVNQLYRLGLMDELAEQIKNGKPYLGCSAGSNITGLSMQTTNDMPIVYPPSFQTLGLLPFNLNPHYLDPNLNSTHMGETRETRINEYHTYNTVPVVGLREGSWLRVKGQAVRLEGELHARIFQAGKEAKEIAPLTDLSQLGR